ncbi:MAG: hypothetical protein HY869_11765 [Chloroflexi bacterium]|nr:hypothetical protein [Chloroflexota bacterium]
MKKTFTKKVLVLAALLLLLATTACKKDAYPNPYPNPTARQSTPTLAPTVQPTATLFVMPASEDAVPRISIEDAKAALDAGTAIFIDVRGTENYNLVHIPGALELSMDQYETGLADVDRDALIITYCT